jgi:hypothetical protein
MKKLFYSIIAGTIVTSTSLAGNWFGSGPWANGAYYPRQYDGVYSASIFGGAPSVVSGVMGFGLRNGSPSIVTNSTTTSSNSIQSTLTVDPFQNYFVVFVNGITYVGGTVATINNQTDQVTGGLYSGVAPNTITATSTNSNTCSGGFTASLTGKKAVITFSGIDTGILQQNTNGVTNGPPNTFSLNGLKVGEQRPQQ